MSDTAPDAAPASAPASRRVVGADGLSIHLLEWSREGVPLVLVHGFGNDAHIWDDYAPDVAPYYRTVAVDLRGHGDSDHDPERRYDYAAHVADLEAVLDALGIERLVLVGHSLGGRVSTLFAAAHPERMAGLVIVDAGPDLDARGTSRIATDAERHAEVRFDSPEDYARLLARAYPATAPEVILRMARHGVRRAPDGRYERKTDAAFHAARGALSEEERAAFEAQTSRSLWAALEQIPCPTLIVRGAASDVLSPDTADRMEETLPNGTLRLVAAASHSVMTDNPGGFAEVVNAFVLGED